MAGVLDFFSPEEGKRRREARDQFLGNLAEGLLGPTGIPERVGLLAEFLNPVVGIDQAGSAAQTMVNPELSLWDRVGAGGRMLTETAGAAAPLAAGRVGGTADDAARAIQEALTGMSATPGAVAGRDFAMDESGMFAGVGAKTADLGMLERAKIMADGGAGREEIWSETGWFKGADDKWRFEIDDSGTEFVGIPRYGYDSDVWAGEYGELLPHESLGAAYPDVSKIDTRARTAENTGGQYMPHQPREHLGLFDITEEIQGGAADAADMRRMLLHEGQHAIQGREGFARGGSSSEFAQARTEPAAVNWGEISPLMQKYNIDGDESGSALSMLNRIRDEMFASNAPFSEIGIVDAERARIAALDRKLPDAFSQYQQLAGEVEARNVEARRNMTPQERQSTPPWLTQDYPEDMQILRGAVGPSAMDEFGGAIRRGLLE